MALLELLNDLLALLTEIYYKIPNWPRRVLTWFGHGSLGVLGALVPGDDGIKVATAFWLGHEFREVQVKPKRDWGEWVDTVMDAASPLILGLAAKRLFHLP